MDDQQKYLFDVQGFVTVEGALDAGQLQRLNAVLDERIAADCDQDMRSHRFGGLLDWGQPYLDLIDSAGVASYLAQILGERFRLDHVYADVIRSGTSPIGAGLHGGGTPFDPSQYYHYENGRMHNGLTVVAYNLADVGPEDGGTGCVPGSHKANFPFPGQWRDMAQGLQPCMRRITGPAGTAVIFTEALTHGALPWTGTGERRTVFYKYSPHAVSWSAGYFDADAYAGISDRQREILEAPNARYGGRKG